MTPEQELRMYADWISTWWNDFWVWLEVTWDKNPVATSFFIFKVVITIIIGIVVVVDKD